METPDDSFSGEFRLCKPWAEADEKPTNPEDEALLNSWALLELLEGLTLPFLR